MGTEDAAPPSVDAAGGADGSTDVPPHVPIGPVCVSIPHNTAPCTTEPPCHQRCGPDRVGVKNCACTNGIWNCARTCAYDPSADTTCYRLPAAVPACPLDSTDPDPSGQGLPSGGSACTVGACMPCGSETMAAFLDSTGSPKAGYCICTTGTPRHYSCATTMDWPR